MLSFDVEADQKMADEKARQRKIEKKRLAELDIEPPAEDLDSGIDFFGLPAQEVEKEVMSMRNKLSSEVLRSWRQSQMSPLFPLTGIDHAKLNRKILGRYRANRSRSAFIEENSFDTACYRFEQHPYEKAIGAGQKVSLSNFSL